MTTRLEAAPDSNRQPDSDRDRGTTMAKRNDTSPAPGTGSRSTSPLIELAEMLLSDHFFDPDRRTGLQAGALRQEAAGAGGCPAGARRRSNFPMGNATSESRRCGPGPSSASRLLHPAFAATVEGTWSFEAEELNQTKISRTGDADTIEAAVDAMIEEIDGAGLDDDEFADFMAARGRGRRGSPA